VRKKTFAIHTLLRYTKCQTLDAGSRALYKVTTRAFLNRHENYPPLLLLDALAPPLLLLHAPAPPLLHLTRMPSCCGGASGFRGIRPCPNGTFYDELRAGSYWLTLSTYSMPELVACVYDTAAWCFRRPRRA
jgi:hypothetical protein